MLKLENLTLKIRNKVLIDAINLQFIPGHIYPLVGDNGSGKTTLLKTMAGIWPPSSGHVLWKGENLLSKPRVEISRVISFIPNTIDSIFDFTVEQFVNMGLYSRGLCHKEEGKKLLIESLKTLEAYHLLHCSINHLSQGEKQRVFMARGLVTQASIFAFDEPTANVDKKHQTLIWNLMEHLIDLKKIIIVATHDCIKSQKYYENIIALNQGGLISFEDYRHKSD